MYRSDAGPPQYLEGVHIKNTNNEPLNFLVFLHINNSVTQQQ